MTVSVSFSHAPVQFQRKRWIWIWKKYLFCLLTLASLFPAPGSQDSKDGLSASVKGTDDQKPPFMPEETGKSKVASWLTSQGLKRVSEGEDKGRINVLMYAILCKRLGGKHDCLDNDR